MANLSDDLEAFIQQEIRSLEQLEVLLLLRGRPERWWSERNVFESIRSSLLSVSDRLAELSAAGFLERSEHEQLTYRYAPNTPTRIRLIDELAEAYRQRRIAVIDAIYRPRTPASELARAFRIKRKEE
jgi:hypothetical protein